MLMGIVQGFLIVLVIAIRSKSENQSIRILGLLIFMMSLVFLDVFLCYTGYMKYIIQFNDSTESLVLLFGPLLYFFLLSTLQREKISIKKYWIHLLLPIVYFLSQLGYTFSPKAVKLNAYIAAFFPEIEFVEVPEGLIDYYQIVKDELRWLIVISLFFYIALSAKLIYQNNQKAGEQKLEDKYYFSRNTVLILALVSFLIFFVFLNFQTDAGDHFIIIGGTIGIFLISFFMLSESRLFERSWIADKYETSGIKSDHKLIFEKTKTFLEKEKYFLKTNCSLKSLAKELNISSNSLSQAINIEAQQNFNDFINQYRIEVAKERLGHQDFEHLSIAGIGNSVGFKSKSTFYTAFKKHTQMTPTEFLKKK